MTFFLTSEAVEEPWSQRGDSCRAQTLRFFSFPLAGLPSAILFPSTSANCCCSQTARMHPGVCTLCNVRSGGLLKLSWQTHVPECALRSVVKSVVSAVQSRGHPFSVGIFVESKIFYDAIDVAAKLSNRVAVGPWHHYKL